MISANHRKFSIISLAGLVLLCFLFWGIKRYHDHLKPAYIPPSVIIQKPTLAEVTEYVTQTGTVVAYNSVDLVARIEGFLEAIHFTDGSFVQKGEELFIVEPEPYADQLKEAEASVASEQASFAYSKIERQRQQKMYKQNATSLNLAKFA